MKASVMVVDDEKNILNLFNRILTVHELKKIRCSDPLSRPIDEIVVHTFESAEDALASSLLDCVDVVISDLAMGGMDGLAFLREARNSRPDLPFIILTGVGTIEDAVESIKLGAYDFVTKPFQRDEVLLSISKAINFSYLQHENRVLRSRLRPVGAGVDESDGERAAMASEGYDQTLWKRAVQLSEDFALSREQLDWLRSQVTKRQSLREAVDMATTIMEAALIKHVLLGAGGNRAEAARQLGISRVAFYRKLKDYGLEE